MVERVFTQVLCAGAFAGTLPAKSSLEKGREKRKVSTLNGRKDTNLGIFPLRKMKTGVHYSLKHGLFDPFVSLPVSLVFFYCANISSRYSKIRQFHGDTFYQSEQHFLK